MHNVLLVEGGFQGYVNVLRRTLELLEMEEG